ncbi:MCE family protein [Williamsia sterculiae]|uniref:Phospholipid/cholesterol/gamma-HCH transport system substrate-binding protein n=1 Tax=Williamsia sterculiae TaxID=1344003 RepID=A0A1N7CSB0_9NOCA|nr:MCE family protein [Williamsia sterculiae]SIR66536.1 phospholipid/cholesterol/gamma-HCH transport system substrate-binding protein [Williamsia sterculiae]
MNQDRDLRRSRASTGVIGVIVTTLVVLVAMQMDKLPYLSDGGVYSALFDDAGGLAKGDKVIVSGVEVGTVRAIHLAATDTGTKAEVDFTLADSVQLGDDSQAVIKTATVLGRRNLTLVPRPGDRLRPGATIPNHNTVAPYSLIDALQGATDTVADTDTGQLNTALNTLSDSFAGTPPQVRGAVDGVARLSKAVADRDTALRQLLQRAGSVSKVLADRSGQIDTLVDDASSLLGELQLRRYAIAQLITGTRDVAAQISGFIADNNAQLTPVLQKLNRVVAILQDNSDNLKSTLDRLGPYANVLGEAVSSGPYFSSLVGIPTFGDYTSTFLKIMQRKYPEAYRAFTYAFNQQPGVLGTRPDAAHDPNSSTAAPPPSYPTAEGP